MPRTPRDGDSNLTRRDGEPTQGTASSGFDSEQAELTSRTNTKISVVSQLLDNCHAASDSAEVRLREVLFRHVLMEQTIELLHERLDEQAKLLRGNTSDGDSNLTHRSVAGHSGLRASMRVASSLPRNSKPRSSSAGPVLRSGPCIAAHI